MSVIVNSSLPSTRQSTDWRSDHSTSIQYRFHFLNSLTSPSLPCHSNKHTILSTHNSSCFPTALYILHPPTPLYHHYIIQIKFMCPTKPSLRLIIIKSTLHPQTPQLITTCSLATLFKPSSVQLHKLCIIYTLFFQPPICPGNQSIVHHLAWCFLETLPTQFWTN